MCWESAIALQTCIRIGGDLFLYDSDTTLLINPSLQSAAGFLQITYNFELTHLELPSLSTVGGDLRMQQQEILTFLNLASLSFVGGFLQLYHHDALIRFELPSLFYVGGRIEVALLVVATSIEFPSLNSFGEELSFESSGFARSNFSSLTSGQGIQFVDCNALTRADFPSLLRLNTGLAFHRNIALTRISCPLLTYSHGLFIVSNAKLTRIDFPVLSLLDAELEVQSNAKLTYTHLPKLTYISGFIRFCINSATFVIPTGTPNAPSGGLKVTGALKGTLQCTLKSGAGACSPVVACP